MNNTLITKSCLKDYFDSEASWDSSKQYRAKYQINMVFHLFCNIRRMTKNCNKFSFVINCNKFRCESQDIKLLSSYLKSYYMGYKV